MEIGDTDFLPYIHIFSHLFTACQILCGQTQGVADRLCQEIVHSTQGRAQLLLRRSESIERDAVASPPPFARLLVQFRDRVYGTLDIAAAPDAEPVMLTNPALPLPVAYILAQLCGWLLYTFELAAFFQDQSQPAPPGSSISLTRREREVLALICRGCNQETIARTLGITPETVKKHKQHIYSQLGVHSEHALPLVAYQAGLFFPLEELP